MPRHAVEGAPLRNVGLRLTDHEIQFVDAIATSRQCTRAEMLRRMVQRVLAAYESPSARAPLGVRHEVTTRFKGR